jgi:DNA modification methylase
MTSLLGGRVVLHGGDNREVLKTFEDNSIDSVVTDGPYALVSVVKRFGKEGAAPAKGNEAFMRASKGFMGKTWDNGEVVNDPGFWSEIYRVLKPGGHLLSFGGTRTAHRMICAVEDAGFEIRDMIAWLYGTGFPKSHDVSKGIDKAAGATREVVGPSATHTTKPMNGGAFNDNSERDSVQLMATAPATDEAAQWQGWGTALKPALEPICLARKPLEAKTVAGNVLAFGTGAINVDGCRVEHQSEADRASATPQGRATAKSGALAGKAQIDFEKFARNAGWILEKEYNGENDGVRSANGENWAEDWEGACKQDNLDTRAEFNRPDTSKGRFPANVIHDGSDEVVTAFPDRKGAVSNGRKGSDSVFKDGLGAVAQKPGYADDGSAARFFYSAKANKRDRANSKHPTVKPVSLMRYLCRLITPPGGTVLDPFAGSGTTGEAALLEGFNCIMIERESEYLADIFNRFARSVTPANDNDEQIVWKSRSILKMPSRRAQAA